MGREKRSPQFKGMAELQVKELNEFEASNLSDIEFKKLVIRMLKKDNNDCKELSGKNNSMKKEIEAINKNQEEMKNTIFETKNTLERITSRLDEAED